MRPRAHVLLVSCLCAATCPGVRSFLCEGPLCAVSQFARRFTRAGDSLPAHTGDSTGGWSGRWRTRVLRRGCARGVHGLTSRWCAHCVLHCALCVRPRAHVLLVSCLCAATCPGVRSFLCEGPLCAVSQFVRRIIRGGDSPTLRDETSLPATSLCHPPWSQRGWIPSPVLSPPRWDTTL